MPTAFLQGVLGASSLALGASLGVFWQPSRAISATIMAFGSGTLISAIAFEITETAYAQSGFWPLLIGFILGGTLFTVLTNYVDEQGGFLRKQSSRRRYLFEHRKEGASEVLKRIAHIEVLQNLPPDETQAIAPLLKPIYVEEGEVLCEEGDLGDALYLIVEGEAEVVKDQRVMTTLGPGEAFGEMALLTGEPRSATVIARTAMELYKLKQDHFDNVLTWSPRMAWALSRALARRLRHTTETRVMAERNLDHWRKQMLESVEMDLLLTENPSMLKGLASRTAPLAILVGTLIDNIPESAVIGMNASSETLSWSFLLAVFISNFPEALSSATGMKQAGSKPIQIMALWIGIVILSGFCASIGSLLAANSSSELFIPIAQAMSGGAILSMLASTMMPEAYELGGGSVAFSTILGFLTSFFISTNL